MPQNTDSGGATSSVLQYDYDAADRLTCSAVRMNPAIFGSLPGSACGQGTFGVYGADRITQYGYDAADQAIRVTSGAGSPVQRDEVTTSYGPDGEVTTQADAKGQLTTLYDHAFDRLGAVCYPTASNPTVTNTNDCERYGYDANGNTTSNTRRDGQVIGYAYDALNRLTSGALGATYAYDNLGRVTQAARDGQSLSFGYDALGRQTSETGPLGTVRRQFDLNGNRTLLTWPDGFAISYFHDAVGELLYTNDGVVQPTHHTWNDLGQVNALYRNNGVNSAFAYGGDQRLSAITHAFPNGASNQSYSFTYNPAGQVASSSSSNPAYDWTAGYTVARGYSVDGQNKYTASGGLALSYDGRGNLASDGVTGFSYDATDKLTSLSNGATLSYDAADRLAQTTGGSTTRFLYDGDQIIGEYDASGNVLRRYVPGPGTDQPIVWYEGSGTSDRRFLITDRQGSVTAVTNASGGVLAINTYDEAGIPGPNNTGRFQYNAAPFIPEAGLYHMRARAYSPTLGRFMQPDPIGYGDGMNVYTYVHGDSVNGWDPSGQNLITDFFRDAGSAIGSFFGGIGSSISSFFNPIPSVKTGLRNIAAVPGTEAPIDFGSIQPVIVTAKKKAAPTNSIDLDFYQQNTRYQSDMVSVHQRFDGVGLGMIGVASAPLALNLLPEAAAAIPGVADIGPTTQTLAGKLSIEEAKGSSEAYEIMSGQINDPLYPANRFSKMEYIHRGLDGSNTTVHFWEHAETGAQSGFKVK